MHPITQLIDSIDHELEELADPAYRELIKTRYNMNVDHFLGVRTPEIHKIAGRYYKTSQSKGIDERFDLCAALLATGIYEHKIMAFRWAYLSRKDFKITHLDVFKGWLDEFVDDWIDCDDLCIHVIGEFFLKYPQRAHEVTSWTSSTNLWTRRGAAVSLVLPARHGEQIALVLDVADILMDDEEDLVKKGYGWLLKVASVSFPDEVFRFVMDSRENMPRIALRYAIEKLPEQLKVQVLGKT